MLRGGLGALGARGGQGAIDGDSASVSLRGLRAKDQGGAFAAGSTRLHIAGLNASSGAAVLAAMLVDAVPGGGSGQMLIAVPEYFPRACRINRLGTRSNGTIGSAGTPRLKMGIWRDGTLGGSGVFAGSPYPGARVAQSADLALLPGANRELVTEIAPVAVDAGTYLWFGWVVNADAAANQHTVWGLRRNALYPILGYTFDVGGPSSVADDSLTFGVGFRHAITYVTTNDLPDPFPQSSPVALTAGAAVDTINIPAIGFGLIPV